MSAISGIDTGYTNPMKKSTGEDVSMGKEDFLMLLVAQLQNQDPMNPQDATEFTAQLAQFSSLEQLTNVNENLGGLSAMSNDMERMSALGMIGQEVIAKTSQFHFNGGPMEVGYRLNTQADDVKMYVLSETGSTLATIPAQETAPGDYFIEWDGYGSNGTPLEPGNYSLVVKAVNDDDKIVQSDSLIKGRVVAVDLSGSTTKLETNSGIFAMSKIEKAGASL